MKIIIPAKITDSTRNVMRKLSYFENYDRKTNQISYIKRLSREGFYPRFHVYIDENQTGRIINLHLDQKKPSYAGASAHNAEYDSTPVKNEAERMRRILEGMGAVSAMPSGTDKKEGKGKGWWRKFLDNFKF